MKKDPIYVRQLRRIPKHFSWIDHRLVQQGYLQQCDHIALSLYLFFLTVADSNGMSYYADASLMVKVSMTKNQLCSARQCLITQGLIAYAPPLIQVLSLDKRPKPPTISHAKPSSNNRKSHPIPPRQKPINHEKVAMNIEKLQATLRHSK